MRQPEPSPPPAQQPKLDLERESMQVDYIIRSVRLYRFGYFVLPRLSLCLSCRPQFRQLTESIPNSRIHEPVLQQQSIPEPVARPPSAEQVCLLVVPLWWWLVVDDGGWW
jgi:hypothetical protein